MSATRLFTLGIVLFLLGVQLRQVKTFVLTPAASRFVEKRLPNRSTTTSYTSLTANKGYEDGLLSGYGNAFTVSSQKSVSPPKWMGWSLMSVGAVLVLGYPCFRK